MIIFYFFLQKNNLRAYKLNTNENLNLRMHISSQMKMKFKAH